MLRSPYLHQSVVGMEGRRYTEPIHSGIHNHAKSVSMTFAQPTEPGTRLIQVRAFHKQARLQNDKADLSTAVPTALGVQP